MSASPSILDELRRQYEAARVTHHDHSEVEGYEQINARLRKAHAWLDKAFSYLDGVKPAIAHYEIAAARPLTITPRGD